MNLNKLVNKKWFGTAFLVLGSLVLFLTLLLEFGMGVTLEFPWMNPFLFVIIGLLSFIVLIYGYTLYLTMKFKKNFDEGGKDIPYLDLTEDAPALPEKFKEHLPKIEALGFTRFATLDASDKHDGSRILWYWADESKAVRVYFSFAKPGKQVYIGFLSVLEDEAVVETNYRVRVQMDAETLHVRCVRSSLEATYTYHLQQLARYEAIHGAPIAISSSAELLEWNNLLKKRHHPLIYQDRIEKLSQYLAIYGGLLLSLIFAYVLAPIVSLPISIAVIVIVLGFCMTYFDMEELEASFGYVDTEAKKKKNS